MVSNEKKGSKLPFFGKYSATKVAEAYQSLEWVVLISFVILTASTATIITAPTTVRIDPMTTASITYPSQSSG